MEENDLSYFATLNQFFACRIVILKLPVLKLNMKARQDMPEILTVDLISTNNIALDINWS